MVKERHEELPDFNIQEERQRAEQMAEARSAIQFVDDFENEPLFTNSTDDEVISARKARKHTRRASQEAFERFIWALFVDTVAHVEFEAVNFSPFSRSVSFYGVKDVKALQDIDLLVLDDDLENADLRGSFTSHEHSEWTEL